MSRLLRFYVAVPVLGLALMAGPALADGFQTKAPSLPETPVKVETVAKGLDQPWGMQFLPDGRMLVTEKPGQLRLVDTAGTVSEPITGVPAVAAVRQGGLLDVALAADYATSGLIFLSYSEPREGGKNGTSVARAKLVLDGAGGSLEDVTVIFRQEPAWSGGFHFGSRIVVKPDGSLYVTTGDRNSARPEVQKPTSGIGKIFHITADGSAASASGAPEGWDPRIWSMGHRNLQGAVLDTSGQLWTTEHGARGGDELNAPELGKNYGWPVISYGREYSGLPIGRGEKSKAGMEQPIYYWDPSIATSGLAFYTGSLFPKWSGNLLVGALSGNVVRLVLDGRKVVGQEVLVPDIGERIRDVRQGPDGAIYVLTDDTDGQIMKLIPG